MFANGMVVTDLYKVGVFVVVIFAVIFIAKLINKIKTDPKNKQESLDQTARKKREYLCSTGEHDFEFSESESYLVYEQENYCTAVLPGKCLFCGLLSWDHTLTKVIHDFQANEESDDLNGHARTWACARCGEIQTWNWCLHCVGGGENNDSQTCAACAGLGGAWQ